MYHNGRVGNEMYTERHVLLLKHINMRDVHMPAMPFPKRLLSVSILFVYLSFLSEYVPLSKHSYHTFIELKVDILNPLTNLFIAHFLMLHN